MPTLLERLRSRDKDIRVAVAGLGSIGSVLLHQAQRTPGIRPVAASDLKLDKAKAWVERLGLKYRIVESRAQFDAALDAGVLALTTDSDQLASTERVDVFLEATNALSGAISHCTKALDHGQHLVMMNFEADLMFGPCFLEQARRNGVVYTSADGDQPTAIKRIVDDIELWGFELVAAGNIKGFHDPYTNPTTIAPEADKRGLDHKMCSSYADGTKLCVEMAVLANALGLSTPRPGMHGPRVKHVLEVFEHLDVERIWREKGPFVDYVLGAEPKGGVFAIGYTESELLRSTLAWYPPELGSGPCFLFYRPYHLGGIEVMNCVVEAVLDGSNRLQPAHGMRTNVFSYAKRDLKAGERIDGMGGYAAYGLIENIDRADARPGLPICISDGLVLRRDVARDEKIYLEDVDRKETSPGFAMYERALLQPVTNRA